MEYWEFLLQKKGDRSWLPLESSDVEILEGRYRIVARSSRKDIPVEIQIRHTSPEDVPPRWRTKNRSAHTNNSGLVSIVPFVHFRPGIWELRCTNDLMSDFVGERWLYSVKLQVIAQEDLVDDDWSGPVVDASSANSETHADAIALHAAARDLNSDTVSITDVQLDLADLALPEQTDQAVDVPTHAETVNVDEPEEIAADTAVPESLAEAEASDPEPVTEFPEPVQIQPDLDASTCDAAGDADDAATATLGDDWDGAVPSSETTMPHDDAQPTHADWRSLAEQMSQDVVDEAFLDVESAIDPQRDVDPNSVTNRDRTLSADAADRLTLAGRPVQLQLQTDAYIVKGGRSVPLTGAITLADSSADSSAASAAQVDSPQLPASVLTIRLFDPQTAQTVDRIQQTVAAQSLPATFQVAIAPPAQRSHLILGEVTLTAEVEGQLLVSASQEFSITTDLNELLDAIANQDVFAAEEAADPVELFNFDAPPVDVATSVADFSTQPDEALPAEAESAIDQPAKPKIEFSAPPAIPFQPARFQPNLGMSLPPQIRTSSSKLASHEHDQAQPADPAIASPPPQPTAPPAPQPAPSASANSSVRFEPLLPKLPTLRPIQPQAAAQASADDLENQMAKQAEESPSAVVSPVDAPNHAPNHALNNAANVAANVDPSLTGNLHGEDAIAAADLAADHLLAAADAVASTADVEDLKTDLAAHAPTPAAVPETDQTQSVQDLQTDDAELFETVVNQQTSETVSSAAADAEDLSDAWHAEEAEDVDVTSSERDTDEAEFDEFDETNVEPTFDLDIGVTAAPVNPLEQSFSSLNLHDRFFSRLSALAFDAQAAQMQQIEDSTAYRPHGVDFDALSEFQSFPSDANEQPDSGDSASLPTESLLPDFDPSPSAEELAREAELTANEVVIYDDEIVVDDVEADVMAASGSSAIADPAYSNPLNDAIEPDIDSWSNLPPLPVPQLKIPSGNLKSGEALDVQVRLPSHPLRVYVKFWMSDRQMRTILDGPRWLADLEPDGQGYLETVVPLVVPKGCLEVQIEAVTVEVATQRQSQKASFNRAVLPMDLPTVSFDEFDLT